MCLAVFTRSRTSDVPALGIVCSKKARLNRQPCEWPGRAVSFQSKLAEGTLEVDPCDVSKPNMP